MLDTTPKSVEPPPPDPPPVLSVLGVHSLSMNFNTWLGEGVAEDTLVKSLRLLGIESLTLLTAEAVAANVSLVLVVEELN